MNRRNAVHTENKLHGEPQMYSYDEYDDYSHEYILKDDLPDLDSARDFLTGIQEAVYKTGDISSLENCLEELCAILDCTFIASKDDEPKIRQRSDLMQWYLGYQRATMDQVMKTNRTIDAYIMEK